MADLIKCGCGALIPVVGKKDVATCKFCGATYQRGKASASPVLIHSQTETVALEILVPPVPPITIVEKFFDPKATENTWYVGSVKVRNDSNFYYYRVWMEYTVSGVGAFTSGPIRLDPLAEGFLYAEFSMPAFDVTIDMSIYAEVVRI